MCDEQPDPSAGSKSCDQGYSNDLAGEGHKIHFLRTGELQSIQSNLQEPTNYMQAYTE